jgi:hypothetical protein
VQKENEELAVISPTEENEDEKKSSGTGKGEYF